MDTSSKHVESTTEVRPEPPGGWPEVVPLLFYTYQMARATLDAAVRSQNSSLSQFGVLRRIYAEPGLSTAAVARYMGITPQSAQGLLVTLEREGLVRKTAPTRGRMRQLWLTDSGRALVETCAPLVKQAEERLLSRLTAAERRRLISAVERFNSVVKAEYRG